MTAVDDMTTPAAHSHVEPVLVCQGVEVAYDGEGEGQNTLSFTPLSIGTSQLLTIDSATSDTATICNSPSNPADGCPAHSTPIASFSE